MSCLVGLCFCCLGADSEAGSVLGRDRSLARFNCDSNVKLALALCTKNKKLVNCSRRRSVKHKRNAHASKMIRGFEWRCWWRQHEFTPFYKPNTVLKMFIFFSHQDYFRLIFSEINWNHSCGAVILHFSKIVAVQQFCHLFFTHVRLPVLALNALAGHSTNQ